MVAELNSISAETESLERELDGLLAEASGAIDQIEGLEAGDPRRLRPSYSVGARLRGFFEGGDKLDSVLARADPINNRLGQLDRDRFRVRRAILSIHTNDDFRAINEFSRNYVFRDRFSEFHSRLNSLYFD